MLVKEFTKPFWRAKEFKVLYHLGFWDGALSGIMLRHSDNQKYYFKCLVDCHMRYEHDEEYINFLRKENIIENEEDLRDFKVEYLQTRTYAIFKLNSNCLENIESDHKLFQEYVGYHTDWDYRWKKDQPKLKERTEWDKFYKENPKKEIPLSGELIGYTTNEELYLSRDLNGQ